MSNHGPGKWRRPSWRTSVRHRAKKVSILARKVPNLAPKKVQTRDPKKCKPGTQKSANRAPHLWLRHNEITMQSCPKKCQIPAGKSANLGPKKVPNRGRKIVKSGAKLVRPDTPKPQVRRRVCHLLLGLESARPARWVGRCLCLSAASCGLALSCLVVVVIRMQNFP